MLELCLHLRTEFARRPGQKTVIGLLIGGVDVSPVVKAVPRARLRDLRVVPEGFVL